MKIIIILLLLNGSFIVASNPNVAFSQNNDLEKALKLMENRNFVEASNLFQKILIKEPNNSVALYNAALSELNSARPDLAMIYLNRFLQTNKTDASAYNLLGISFERLGFIDSAIISFSEAIKLDENFYDAFFNRGRIFFSQNKFNDAKSDFNFAKKNKIINPELYFASGSLNYEMRFFDSAIADLTQIIKYKNDNINFLLLLANSFFLTSNFDSAIKYYTQILEIEPNDITVLNNRAVSFGELEMRDEAAADHQRIELIRKDVEINPNEIEFRTLIPADSAFSIDIPKHWRLFARNNSEKNIREVIFFDPEFDFLEKNGFYNYDFGGMIIFIPQYFETVSNLATALSIREIKVAEHIENRKAERNEIFGGFREKMRKIFNPNDKNARELTNAIFFDAETFREFFGIEYFIMTTSGKLICLYLWIPVEHSFRYESIMTKIQESLQINESIMTKSQESLQNE